MFIKVTRVRRREKVYQYAHMVEAVRRPDGVVTQKVIAPLGPRTDVEITNLRRALEASRTGRVVVFAEADADADPNPFGCEVLDNLAWLDIAVVVALLCRLGVDRILEDVMPREGAEVPDADVVMALVAQRCVAPDSKLAATEWFSRTALPELLSLPMARFNNSRIHRVLNGLEACEEVLQARLASAICAHQGAFSLLFMDLTDTWFVGRGPALATQGKTKEGLYRRKVGIVLLCDQHGHPLRWSVVEGRRHDSGPMKELAVALQSTDWARGVPMVFDRAMGATAHIEELLATGRPFVTALSRNEFDVYVEEGPWAALAELSWTAPDAAKLAAQAVLDAGLTRHSDTLFVCDLGVVTRKEPEPPATQPPVAGNDKCRVRLAAAHAMQTALDNGEAKDLIEAGRPHGFERTLACRTLRLLRLAPDLQQAVEDGEADLLSIQDLLRLTDEEDFEVQRATFRDTLEAARQRPDKRRTRSSGPKSAAPPKPPEPTTPPQLRAVISFNPEHWLRQMQAADKLLGDLRTWTRRKNDALRAGSSSDVEKVREEAMAHLRHDHLVEACQVEVLSEVVDGKTVHQLSIEPHPEGWHRRQRFFGFQVIVARPDEVRPPVELVQIYRAKDAVEKDFQTIKSVLQLRPVRHRTDAKVRAHVTLCMLALLVERMLDRALQGQATGVAALATLADIHLNRLRTRDNAQVVYTITRPKADHLALLRPLGLLSLVDDAEVTATLHPR